MEKTIVLIRTTDFASDSRAKKTAVCLAKGGYKVIIFAWDRDLSKAPIEIFKFQKTEIIIYYFQRKCPNGSGLRSFSSLIKFMLWLKRKIKELHKEIYAIHSCDLDTGIVCKYNAKKYKIPLIYDIYDYYIDSHNSIPKILSSIIERLEISIINYADVTIVCNEARINQIKKSRPKSIIVIHNTPDISFLETVKKENIRFFNICYFGVLNDGRLIEEITSNFPYNDKLTLDIGGIGPLANKIEELSKTNKNIKWWGKVPYETVLNVQKNCNLLFATYIPTNPNHRYSAPNKVYEAMALGIPVIVCNGTGIDELVNSEGIGLSIDYDVNRFFDAVNFLKNNSKACEEMGEKGKLAYNNKYSWSLMEKKLLELYGRVTKC